MTPISPEYLFVALIIIVGYWLLPRRVRLEFLSILSVLCLGYFSLISAITLILLCCFVFFASQCLRFTKRGLVLSVISLALLFSVYRLMQTTETQQPLLLIGLSFYLLKAIHYLIETYKSKVPRLSLIELFAYLTFFPALLIGPIHRADSFLRDWQRQSFSWPRVSLALERVIWGYLKIVVFADYLVSGIFANKITEFGGQYPRLAEYLFNVEYGLHLYLNFSGFTDIAIAVAAMLGFRLPENFNNPFLSRNITEFWTRWHMSLTEWCRTYIYVPIAALSRHHQFAVFTTMLSIGLWHELTFRYLLWGSYHGMGLIIHSYWSQRRSQLLEKCANNQIFQRLFWFGSVLFTLNFVMLGFSITRKDTLSEIIGSYKLIFFGLL